MVDIHPSELDMTGNIEVSNGVVVNGQKTTKWEVNYIGVRCKQIPALKLRVNEKEELTQMVFIEKLSWIIRREDRNIVPNAMRFVVEGDNHFIVNVRRWKGSRNWLVLDTEFRDNQ
jgi:hypothetical protein